MFANFGTLHHQNYRFSQEELQVIAECESEAFYNRSLPLSLALGAGSYLGVKNGIFKVVTNDCHSKQNKLIKCVFSQAHSSLGPWPKVITFSIIGYIAGRISYNKKCQEKMMALPNSRFAEMLRRNLNRKTNQWDVGRQEAGAATALSLAPFQSATSSNSDHLNQVNVAKMRYSFIKYLIASILAKFTELGHKPTTLFQPGWYIYANDGRNKWSKWRFGYSNTQKHCHIWWTAPKEPRWLC